MTRARRLRPRAAPPEVASARTPIDQFILARLQGEEIEPSPEADRRTLLRRLSLDLTGLPPTREQMQTFLADRSPEAYERAVDSLLASEHYGEKWAMHWLDQVRYADSDGYEKDNVRPNQLVANEDLCSNNPSMLKFSPNPPISSGVSKRPGACAARRACQNGRCSIG